MKGHADLAIIDLGEMVVFHKNDTNFDLIISGDSELAKHGSLSFTHNMGPKEYSEVFDNKEIIEEADVIMAEDKLKQDLIICQKEKKESM